MKRVRVFLALGMSLLSVLSTSPPVAASDVHDVTVELHRGRIDLVTSAFGTIDTDYPGSGVAECPGIFEISADFNYKTRSTSLTDLYYKVPFVLPIFGGTYQAEATGIERSGSAPWDHDGTHEWGPISERFDFEIQTFNPDGCVKGELECGGRLEMEFNGVTRNARDALPDVYVRGTTTEAIEVREPCEIPWIFLLPGAFVRLDERPVDAPDPGAWFRAPAP